jgi:hypothetical protein
MASLRKRSRNWFYRFTDADGVKVEKKGCPDRRATEEMAREAATQAARTRAGLIDPKATWPTGMPTSSPPAIPRSIPV